MSRSKKTKSKLKTGDIQSVLINEAVPVIDEVDVLVAGGGIAGSMAALAAARQGARTAVIERFGCLGGNLGPGMISGRIVHLALGFPGALPNRLQGIPGEFINRCEGYCDGQLGHDCLRDSQVVSYILFKMMAEHTVRLLLNTVVSEPIMQGRRLTGLTVETKGGRMAIRAKVVIDATGDADVAYRAGAPTDPDTKYMLPGLYFAIGGVETERFTAFINSPCQESPEDAAWRKQRRLQDGGAMGIMYPAMVPLYRRAWEMGDYRYYGKIGDIAVAAVDHGFYPARDGIVDGQIGLNAKRHLDVGNPVLMSELEAGARQFIFESALFMRHYVPGCGRSYLVAIAPYFHFRGGRSIKAEYALTNADVKDGRQFDDVLFVVYGSETNARAAEGNDFPYRQLLPQAVEGLLVAGRTAIVQPPVMRDRWKVLLMGQAAGVAAALAVERNVTPRTVNVRDLQRVLYNQYHSPMGHEDRLRALGIVI